MSKASKKDPGFRITRPTLIVDKNRVLGNIERMVTKTTRGHTLFRPHFKTHQSSEIGRWFRDFGVSAIAVSSVDMAVYFAENGWSDITIAFPVNVLETERIAQLAEKVSLGVLVDSEIAASALHKRLSVPVDVWIKIDAGYGRVGLPWHQHEQIASLAREIQNFRLLNCAGILAHNGHTYQARTTDDVRRIHAECVSRLGLVKNALNAAGIVPCRISIGDTPSCSLVDDFTGIDEIRPGNFVFYDITQASLGSCTDDEIAVAVACPIVGKYEHRGHLAVYGGAVHLSKETILDKSNRAVYGYVSWWDNQSLGSPDYEAAVVSVSQEHGIVQVTEERLKAVSIGDVPLVFPVHSCLTCNLYSEYRTLDGEILRRM